MLNKIEYILMFPNKLEVWSRHEIISYVYIYVLWLKFNLKNCSRKKNSHKINIILVLLLFNNWRKQFIQLSVHLHRPRHVILLSTLHILRHCQLLCTTSVVLCTSQSTYAWHDFNCYLWRTRPHPHEVTWWAYVSMLPGHILLPYYWSVHNTHIQTGIGYY